MTRAGSTYCEHIKGYVDNKEWNGCRHGMCCDCPYYHGDMKGEVINEIRNDYRSTWRRRKRKSMPIL